MEQHHAPHGGEVSRVRERVRGAGESRNRLQRRARGDVLVQNEDELGQRGAGASVFSALGLTLLGTTCCALPITLIALGAGGAVASVTSALPWLVALSE